MARTFNLSQHINSLVHFSEYPDPSLACSSRQVVWVNRWEKVMKQHDTISRMKHIVMVAVYPSAEI